MEGLSLCSTFSWNGFDPNSQSEQRSDRLALALAGRDKELGRKRQGFMRRPPAANWVCLFQARVSRLPDGNLVCPKKAIDANQVNGTGLSKRLAGAGEGHSARG
jgi:hypothetical protein